MIPIKDNWNSLFYGALRFTDVMFDGVVSFYGGFVYNIFI